MEIAITCGGRSRQLIRALPAQGNAHEDRAKQQVLELAACIKSAAKDEAPREASRLHDRRNLESARLVLSDPDCRGGRESFAVIWARSVLRSYCSESPNDDKEINSSKPSPTATGQLAWNACFPCNQRLLGIGRSLRISRVNADRPQA